MASTNSDPRRLARRCGLPFALAAGVMASWLSGCGGEAMEMQLVFPTSGKLTSDGAPAEGAIVILHPTDPQAELAVKPRGKVRGDGMFELTTFATGDGAPPGEYLVTVYWPEPPPPGEPVTDDGPDQLDGRYMSPDQPLTKVVIDAQENVLAPMELAPESTS